ncbi:MAG: type II secretion system protein N [Steroidobacteraceae bacterium]
MSPSLLRWALPGVAAFLLVLLVRLPAAWLLPLLPSALTCTAPEGTVWNGRCMGMQLRTGAPDQALALDRVGWVLRPTALLRGRLAAQLQLARAGGEASGLVSWRPRSLQVDALSGRLPMDRQLAPMLPAGWQGQLLADELSFTVEGGRIARLQGMAGVQQLQDAQGTALGSYELKFAADPAGPPFAGQLHDSGGPLSVQAAVRVEPQGAWQVDGRVAPRADAAPGLVKQLRLLGLPAADGSYPFSLAGE